MRGLFDAWSRYYDVPVLQSLTYRPVQTAVVEALRAYGAPQALLDVGCGTGMLARRLARELPGARVTGCDLSRGMLSRAAMHAAAMHADTLAWVQGDALRLPFGDQCFDTIVCTAALHWFPDQCAALREFRRVLRPGGRVALALVSPPLAAIGTIAWLMARAVGQPFHWPTAAGMRRLVAAADLRLESQRHLRLVPPGPLLPPVVTVAIRPCRMGPP